MAVSTSFDPWAVALGQSQLNRANSKDATQRAAESFEALLIRQFLSSARSTSWLSESNESESGWREIADDALAGYLVKAGGLGLSKQLNSLLSQASAARSSAIGSGRELSLSLARSNSLNLSSDRSVTRAGTRKSDSVGGVNPIIGRDVE
ncbi:MAG: hypothetical protein EBV34_18225 [Betaproteobacteria bacterium]|nr:hypothetical protein [Betaproteobacteria bacterium]NBT82092.1 hypothetical protein [Betaproteobacteria bacterium]NDE53741.1 hypothetical protein [Actinomycetota bacterium]